MKKIKEKKIFLVAVLVVAILAIFLRTYKFGEYLHFKWDQARDLQAISEAYDKGFRYLPLLGPRAVKMEVDGEKEQLRLGAGYYYLQYFTAKIFNSQEPDKIAYFELLCSLGSLVMLYLFCRLFFDKWFSLLATSLYALSLMAIQFSRFAWNPNAIVLFVLICFYALLKFFKEHKFQKKITLVIVWSVSFGIAGHLHFMGLFFIGAISIFYIIYKNKEFFIGKGFQFNFKWENFRRDLSYVLVALASFALVNTTTIMAEVAYDMENSRNFFAAFSAKSEDNDLLGKFIKNTKIHGENYLVILSGIYFEKEDFPFNLFFAGVGVMAAGFFTLIFLIRKTEDRVKKDFLIFLLIWFLTYFFLTIPIAYKHYIRYFLIVFPLPFILITAVVNHIQSNTYKKWLKLAIWFLPCLVVLSNTYKTIRWFGDLKMVQQNSSAYFNNNSPIRNREKDDVTLGQLQRAVNFMYAERENDIFITYNSPIDYKISFEYLFYLKNKEMLAVFAGENDIETPLSENYFAISNKKKKEELIPEIFFKKGYIEKEAVFGQLVIYKFRAKTKPDGSKVDQLFQEKKLSGLESDHYKITIDDFIEKRYKK